MCHPYKIFAPGPDDAVFDVAGPVGDQRTANAVQRLYAHVLLGRQSTGQHEKKGEVDTKEGNKEQSVKLTKGVKVNYFSKE